MTRTDMKEAIRKIAASQLTVFEYWVGNDPLAGGAAVSRHHDREGESGAKGMMSSMMG